MASSNSGSPTDGRLTSTLAAAPRAAASPSREATLRSLEALTLLRPASASAAATSSTQASTQRSGTSVAWRAAALRAVGADRLLVVRVARQLHRGGEVRRRPRRPHRPARGTGRPGARPVSLAQARRSAWARTSGDPRRGLATIATRAAPRLAATAEALPPPGTGAADPSSPTNPSRVRSRKRVTEGSTARLYGCDSARIVRNGRREATDVRATTCVGSAARRAGVRRGGRRYRRARPEPDVWPAAVGGPPSAGRRAGDPSSRGAEVVFAIRPRVRTSRRGRSPSSAASGAGRSGTAARAACRPRRACAGR